MAVQLPSPQTAMYWLIYQLKTLLWELHDEMLEHAIANEKQLRAGLSNADIAEFLRIAKVMQTNVQNGGGRQPGSPPKPIRGESAK